MSEAPKAHVAKPPQKKRTGGGWNSGKTIGRKRPFSPEQIGIIRTGIRATGDARELALFEMALATLLRSSDLLRLTWGDVLGEGNVVLDEFDVRQKKTKSGVHISLSGAAKAALAAYAATKGQIVRDANVWTEGGRTIKRLRYSQIVKRWARLCYADPRFYSTHSLRRTTAHHVFKQTNNHEVVRQLLGHRNLAMTVTYLDVAAEEAHAVKKKFEL